MSAVILDAKFIGFSFTIASYGSLLTRSGMPVVGAFYAISENIRFWHGVIRTNRIGCSFEGGDKVMFGLGYGFGFG